MNEPSQPHPEEWISAYLDGELSPEESKRVELLLRDDADMRLIYDELRALRETLKTLPIHTLDENFHRRVLRQAERASLAGEPRANGGSGNEGATQRDGAPHTAPARPADGGGGVVIDEAAKWRRRFFWSIAASAAAIFLAVTLPYWRAPQVTLGPDTHPRAADDRVVGAPVGGRSEAIRPDREQAAPGADGSHAKGGSPPLPESPIDLPRAKSSMASPAPRQAQPGAGETPPQESVPLLRPDAGTGREALEGQRDGRYDAAMLEQLAKLPAPSAEEMPGWLASTAQRMQSDLVVQVYADGDMQAAQRVNSALLHNGIVLEAATTSSREESGEQQPAGIDAPADMDSKNDTFVSDADATTYDLGMSVDQLSSHTDNAWGVVVVEGPPNQVLQAIQEIQADPAHESLVQLRLGRSEDALFYQQADGSQAVVEADAAGAEARAAEALRGKAGTAGARGNHLAGTENVEGRGDPTEDSLRQQFRNVQSEPLFGRAPRPETPMQLAENAATRARAYVESPVRGLNAPSLGDAKEQQELAREPAAEPAADPARDERAQAEDASTTWRQSVDPAGNQQEFGAEARALDPDPGRAPDRDPAATDRLWDDLVAQFQRQSAASPGSPAARAYFVPVDAITQSRSMVRREQAAPAAAAQGAAVQQQAMSGEAVGGASGAPTVPQRAANRATEGLASMRALIILRSAHSTSSAPLAQDAANDAALDAVMEPDAADANTGPLVEQERPVVPAAPPVPDAADDTPVPAPPAPTGPQP